MLKKSTLDHLWIISFLLLCITVSAGILLHEQVAHQIDITIDSSTTSGDQSPEEHHDEEENEDHILFTNANLFATNSVRQIVEEPLILPTNYLRTFTPPPPELV